MASREKKQERDVLNKKWDQLAQRIDDAKAEANEAEVTRALQAQEKLLKRYEDESEQKRGMVDIATEYEAAGDRFFDRGLLRSASLRYSKARAKMGPADLEKVCELTESILQSEYEALKAAKSIHEHSGDPFVKEYATMNRFLKSELGRKVPDTKQTLRCRLKVLETVVMALEMIVTRTKPKTPVSQELRGQLVFYGNAMYKAYNDLLHRLSSKHVSSPDATLLRELQPLVTHIAVDILKLKKQGK